MTVLMPASLAAVRHLRMQGGSLGEKMGSFTGVTILLSRQRDFIACRAAGSLTLEILCSRKGFYSDEYQPWKMLEIVAFGKGTSSHARQLSACRSLLQSVY